MHKVKRNEAPNSLIDYNKKYLREYKNKDSKYGWENFSGRKVKQDTLNSLNEMYNGCCAYCEGYIKSIAFPEIEHFKPKSKFPKLMFDYNNLHYSCPICNKNKADKWEEWFISPTEDNPEEHIKFEGYMAVPISSKGSEMIKMLELNIKAKKLREELYNDMKDVWNLIIYSYEELDKTNKEKVERFKEKFKIVKQKIEERSATGEQYCTMLKHNFRDKLNNLQKELEKL